jgi:hypothetical protein
LSRHNHYAYIYNKQRTQVWLGKGTGLGSQLTPDPNIITVDFAACCTPSTITFLMISLTLGNTVFFKPLPGICRLTLTWYPEFLEIWHNTTPSLEFRWPLLWPLHLQKNILIVKNVKSWTKQTHYVCDVTLSVYAHRTSLKNMPGHGKNRTWFPPDRVQGPEYIYHQH